MISWRSIVNSRNMPDSLRCQGCGNLLRIYFNGWDEVEVHTCPTCVRNAALSSVLYRYIVRILLVVLFLVGIPLLGEWFFWVMQAWGI